MIYCVIWTVLMIFWICFGAYWNYDQAKPYGIGNTIIPWVCVLILGLIIFGAISVQMPVMIR